MIFLPVRSTGEGSVTNNGVERRREAPHVGGSNPSRGTPLAAISHLSQYFAKYYNIDIIYSQHIDVIDMAIEHRKVERVVKGFANHNRLRILELLERKPELSVAQIAEELSMGYENTSDHIRKLAIAGLLIKRNDGPSVLHKLTSRAKSILVFCKKLQ